MDKVLLRSALWACFNDMTQHCQLLLLLAGGISVLNLARRLLVDSHLVWPVFLCIPSTLIKCTNGDVRVRSGTESEDKTTGPSGRVRIGLV
jgi:hypothetical protein